MEAHAQVSSSKQKIEQPQSSITEKMMINGVNSTFSLGAIGLEVARWSKYNYRGAEVFGNTVNPHDAMFELMQNMGDIGPGFVASSIAYMAIDILTVPYEKITEKHVPVQVKVAAATLLGIGAIIVHEKGYFFTGAVDNGNNSDAIFGMLGPIAFAGTQYLVKDLIKKIDERIMVVKTESMMSLNEAK